MRAFFIGLICASVIAPFSNAPAENWSHVASTPGGTEAFVDIDSIKVDGGRVSFLQKWDARNDKGNGGKLQYIEQSFDCASKTTAISKIDTIGTDGASNLKTFDMSPTGWRIAEREDDVFMLGLACRFKELDEAAAKAIDEAAR